MALKVNMSKTYDRVEWGFLSIMKVKMGFAAKWVDLVMQCVTIISYLVSLNGKVGPSFKSTNGLRQGEPFNPFLFLICSEGLSSLMRLTVRDILLGVKASRNGSMVSHLLFVEDCILFREATVRRTNALRAILKGYKANSRECANFEKSTIFFNSNTIEEVQLQISRDLGMRC